MSVFKCKMCGGTLEVREGATVCECEYCGTRQTISASSDETIRSLFNRANSLRMRAEFDKAGDLYEKILQLDSTEAEAYWGLILCKYGVEYVEDPKTLKRIPTCHRTSFDAVTADDDYKNAVYYASADQKGVYEAEAKAIDEIQKGILSISGKEDPYDVFICYKETDENGKRTQDSVIANDIYYQLTQQGFKVFYAAITLEDKLGTEYEPYIFSALNSSKVMLALGTKPEYFNAVWVKNEWSRFLQLMKKDRSKLLIPCYRDMDAYELPEEFAHLQAQDMSKIGFINDIVRGIKKVIVKEEKKPAIKEAAAAVSASSGVAPLLKRAFMFLEDGEWAKADEFCEQVLNQDPENAQAYLGKLMASLRVSHKEDLKNCLEPFDSSNYYQKALRFADSKMSAELTSSIDHINNRNEIARQQSIYDKAKAVLCSEITRTEDEYKQAAQLFGSIPGFADADNLTVKAYEKTETTRKDNILAEGKALISQARDNISKYEYAIKLLKTIPGWKDADKLVIESEERIDDIRTEAAVAAIKRKKIVKIVAPIGVVLAVFVVVLVTSIIPNNKYKQAEQLAQDGAFDDAIQAMSDLGGFKDASSRIKEFYYKKAEAALAQDDYESAYDSFLNAGDYNDAESRLGEGYFNHASLLISNGQYEDAIQFVEGISKYYESKDDKKSEAYSFIKEIQYKLAEALLSNGERARAAMLFGKIWGYSDARTRSITIWNEIANRETVSPGSYNTLGVKTDGKVYSWEGLVDVIAVSGGGEHSLVLLSYGMVRANGRNNEGQCKVQAWTNIVSISAGRRHSVGLRADGTVVAVGDNTYGQCNVEDWEDIIDVSAGFNHTVGLKADGTVVAVGRFEEGQCSVARWNNIVAISAGGNHTVALMSDGTVEATGNNEYGQCNVYNWTDIVAITTGGAHTVALKSDGTVVAVGYNEHGQCEVSGWDGIISISAGGGVTTGLKSDGTVVAIGNNTYGQCEVSGWTDILLPGDANEQ